MHSVPNYRGLVITHKATAHSFRIGAATTGLPPWLIKTLGWWNSDAYIQTPTSLIKTVPFILVRTDIPDDTPPWNPDVN